MTNLSNFNIDWNKVEITDYKPLEPATYAAKVISSEIAKTKKGDTMLKLTFEILGSNKGRKLFENYMLQHSNPKAVQAGLGRVKSLAACLDIDFDQLQDTSEFHGKPVGVKLKIEESEQYGAQNRVVSFQEYEESFLTPNVGKASQETVKVDTVNDEPEMVEDEDVAVASPSEIRAMKKDAFMKFVKDQKVDIVLTGKKLSELKEEVVNKLYGVTVEDEDEDIVIED